MESLITDESFKSFVRDNFDPIIFRYIAKKERSFFYQWRIDSSLYEILKNPAELLENILNFNFPDGFNVHLKSTIKQEDKERSIYKATPYGLLFTILLAQFIAEELSKDFSDELYSFRKGYSRERALRNLYFYHKRMKRGELNLYKGDVSGYGDNIDQDILIRILAKRFDADSKVFHILKLFIKIHYITKDNSELQVMEKGIPTGSPLTPIFENIYLMELDEVMAGSDERIYFRYGDDILYLNKNLEQFDDKVKSLKDCIHGLNLDIKPSKELYVYSHKEKANYYEWLGFSFDENYKLTSRKKYLKQFKDDYLKRLRALLKNLQEHTSKSPELIMAKAFDLHYKLLNPYENNLSYKLITYVENDHFLKQLDENLIISLVKRVSRFTGLSRKDIWRYKHKNKKASLNYYRRSLDRKKREHYHERA